MPTYALPSTLFILINAVCFQLVWWSGVIAQNQLIILSILLIIGHFVLSNSARHDALLMGVGGAIGIVVDSLLVWFGVFEFNIIPYWLAILWCYFALSLDYSLAFFKTLPLWLQSILGGVFGCLSYLTGAKFDAVVLPLGYEKSALILALIWSGLFPVLLWVSKRIAPANMVLENNQ
jgi:hypothetical protein